MRITGGHYKNRKLVIPEGNQIRPTSDRMRQTIFNLLHHAKWAQDFNIQGSHVLDLFCGSGALGIESLSHGAAHASFADIDVHTIATNTKFLDSSVYQIHKKNASSILLPNKHTFNLVFMDPPYREGLVNIAIKNLLKNVPLHDQAIIIIECEKELSVEYGDLEILDQRKQGQSNLNFFRYHAVMNKE
jgi:16S rRNA (guanine966-N2)-methyltransferase